MGVSCQAPVVLAHLFDQSLEGFGIGLGLRCDAGQFTPLEPGVEFGFGQIGQQHPAGRGGVRWQTRPQMQAIGQRTHRLGAASAARHDHTLPAIEHHR